MKNLQEVVLHVVPQQDEFDIPTDYRARALWFSQEFGDTLSTHLQNLCRFCDNIPKNQGISYSDMQNGYVHAHYGKFSIYFPVEKLENKMSALDWMSQYVLEVDHVDIPLETGIQEVQDEVRRLTAERLKTSSQRLVDKLLPERLIVKKQEITSKNIIIKRAIRIKKR